MRIKTFTTLLFMIPIYSVLGQNGFSLELNIKTTPTEEITINETGVGLSVFGNINAKTKITNTFEYSKTDITYQIENYGLQNNLNQFNSFENTFELTHQLTGKTKLNFEITPSFNYEKNIDFEDLSILGSLGISHELNAENKINIGIGRTTAFGKPEILPSFSFYHQIKGNSYMEIGFPNSIVSYSNNIRNKFSITNSFNGKYYNLDYPRGIENDNTASKASFSQMTSLLEYERNMDTNWYVNLKGGYDFNKRYTLENSDGNTNFDFNINNGYILNIGIKYKY